MPKPLDDQYWTSMFCCPGEAAKLRLGDAEECDPVLRAARLLYLTGLVEQPGRGFLVPEVDLALVIVGGAGAGERA